MLSYEQCIFDDLYSIVLEKEMVMLFFVGVCDVRKGCPSTEILQEAGLARETSGLLQVYTLQVFPQSAKNGNPWKPTCQFIGVFSNILAVLLLLFWYSILIQFNIWLKNLLNGKRYLNIFNRSEFSKKDSLNSVIFAKI